MADETMKADQTISGTYGRVWVNEQLLANVKKFEVKKKAVYEDVDIAGQMGKSRKLVGYEVSGTITLNKIDSFAAKLLSDSWDNGKNPDIKIVARVNDPAVAGQERVTITGVTFDELTFGFEIKKLSEEELSFEAETLKYDDTI